MSPDDFSGDVQSKSAAGHFVAHAGAPVELLEDLLPIPLRNARPLIDDPDHDSIFARIDPKQDLGEGGGEYFRGVVDELPQREGDQFGIDNHIWNFRAIQRRESDRRLCR